jgi:hypothetical protein
MPERDIQRETMHAGTPLTVGEVALLPIERVVFHAHRMHRGLWCAALREPCALIVRDAKGVRVVGVCAVAPTLEALRAQMPDLESVLAAL